MIQTCNEPFERRRIEQAGGFVSLAGGTYRVQGILGVSRYVLRFDYSSIICFYQKNRMLASSKLISSINYAIMVFMLYIICTSN
ncbi:hypothetical protein DICVIV_11192 [Dictyocaulus viviparus]|uniref:PPM-type phosphatase domain-containing protein n=1 Tax=Dictyocaulus viviparus TaxID=29172 RepID=A0A0D8XGE6_DICVI|nr:hypothetical protein DICVIV_11192 [Dictyocaulus viviparus]